VTSLAFDFGEPVRLWSHIPIEDPRAAALADRHYSRQTVGAKGFVPAGERFALWHEDDGGCAVWAVCRNMDPVGTIQWRNTIFRNESAMLSSELIIDATRTTYELWMRRYHALPSEPLTTEIDVAATRARRSRTSPPGICYLKAGWTFVRELDPGHGRPLRVILQASR